MKYYRAQLTLLSPMMRVINQDIPTVAYHAFAEWHSKWTDEKSDDLYDFKREAPYLQVKHQYVNGVETKVFSAFGVTKLLPHPGSAFSFTLGKKTSPHHLITSTVQDVELGLEHECEQARHSIYELHLHFATRNNDYCLLGQSRRND